MVVLKTAQQSKFLLKPCLLTFIGCLSMYPYIMISYSLLKMNHMNSTLVTDNSCHYLSTYYYPYDVSIVCILQMKLRLREVKCQGHRSRLNMAQLL